jgi:cell shape-determining protein MreC
MFYDQRGTWLEKMRYGLQATIYPLQLAVNSPSAAWRWMEESFATRESLQQELARLSSAAARW